jgi:hypothetical protein
MSTIINNTVLKPIYKKGPNDISSSVFCDWQGVSNIDRTIIIKMYPALYYQHTFDDWYQKLSVEFNIGEKRTIKRPEILISGVISSESNIDSYYAYKGGVGVNNI